MTASCRPARRLFEGQALGLIFGFESFCLAPMVFWEYDIALAAEGASRWESGDDSVMP
jgi:hypothetical protein